MRILRLEKKKMKLIKEKSESKSPYNSPLTGSNHNIKQTIQVA